jgi:D-alanyl-D-alanine carboxypeptidase
VARGVKVARAVWAATIAFTLVALSTVPTAAARATATPRLGARAAALLEMTTGEQVYADDADASPASSALRRSTRRRRTARLASHPASG